MFDLLMEFDRVTLHDTESPVGWAGDDLLDLHLARIASDADAPTFAFTFTPPAFVNAPTEGAASTAPAKSTRDILATMRALSGLPPKGQAA